MLLIAKYVVMVFGFFLICVGLLMLLNPGKARAILRKAGSTNLINYSEITIRLIPAIGLVISSEIAKYPAMFELLGWFMIITCALLYMIPRRFHHAYSLWSANILKPRYIRLISPLSILFGCVVMYSVL